MWEDKLSEIIENYKYTKTDVEIVKQASDIVLPHVEEFSEKLHEHVFSFEHARAFLKTSDAVKYHKQKIEYWISQVFIGVYTKEYYDYLTHINFLHKRIGLPSNYINSTFTFIRRFIRQKLNDADKISFLDSVEKVIDLNLELLSTQYVGENFEETLKMIRLIREAIDNDYIQPVFQKIVSADTLEISSYECLCRIDHPIHGTIFPNSFMDIAKQIGVYGEITHAMFKKSFQTFADTKIPFSLNVSFLDIKEDKIRSDIRALLQEFTPGKQLIIEIVETEELDDLSIMYDFIQEMRSYGAQIAVDDFGSGYSNFNNINKLKPDYLKIDGSLIKDIDENTINFAAVESIVGMAKKLGMQTVAEFVHSKDICKICQNLGISKIQGYYIAKPEPLDIDQATRL